VKLLLKDKRVDLSDIGNSLFQVACEYSHFEIVKLLKKDKRVMKLIN